MEERPSKFGGSGAAYYFGAKEVAHFHAGNALDLRLTRRVIRELREDLGVPSGPRKSASDWIELRFRSEADLVTMVGLVERALRAAGRKI